MFINNKTVCKDKNGRLLVFDTSRYGGIYQEVSEKEVPKRYRITDDELGGAGMTKGGDFHRSNTSGITSGKYFKKVGEKIEFYPKNYEEIKKNSVSVDRAIGYFEDFKSTKPVELYLRITDELDMITILVDMDIHKNYLVPSASEYIEYCDNFRNCYNYKINFMIFIEDEVKEKLELIKNMFDLSKEESTRKKINLEELKKYVDILNVNNNIVSMGFKYWYKY